MHYPCLTNGHKLTFYLTRFKTGALTPWFHCVTCCKQSNWLKKDEIPLKYQETMDEWEWRGHLEGVPYFTNDPVKLEPLKLPAVMIQPVQSTTNCPKPEALTELMRELEFLRTKVKNIEAHRDRLHMRVENQELENLKLRQKIKAFTSAQGRRL